MSESAESGRPRIFYQIYQRSFQDSNAKGGRRYRRDHRRLPYLLALGVDAIWRRRIFPPRWLIRPRGHRRLHRDDPAVRRIEDSTKSFSP